MKAMTKTQLAACAGVSVRTFSDWLAPIASELARMGYPPGKRSIPPNVVNYLAELFCIDIEPKAKLTHIMRQ